jgi:hypothetical protein
MKKLAVFCSFIFSSIYAAAQPRPAIKNVPGQTSSPAVCGVVVKILENRANDFRNIYTGTSAHEIFDINRKAVPAVDGLGNEKGYNTKLKFQGAKASFVSSVEKNDKISYRYIAYYGAYESENAAVRKSEEVKKQLSGCLSVYQVEKRPKSAGDVFDSRILLEKYEFSVKDAEKERPKIVLLLEYGNFTSEYFVFLLIEGNSFMNMDEITANEPATPGRQSSLANQLNQLLDYAKDGFKAIRDEEMKQPETSLTNYTIDKKIYRRFKTGFLPEGAEKSEIRNYPDDKSTKFIASYDYVLWPESPFRELFTKMKKELGSDFIVEVDEQSINKKDYVGSQKAVFYRKDSKLPHIELIYNSDTDTLNNGMPPGILIVVEAPDSQPNITYAQVKKINEQLSSIVADYAKNFATIKGEVKTTGSKANYYSKIELQGADSVYLSQNLTTGRLDFIAVYPDYSTKEEARKKFNELVAQIDKCRFSCCTFAKTAISEHDEMVVQAWLPFDLYHKMEAAYENISLEVEIHKGFEIDTKSEKLAISYVWQLVFRVSKL